MSRYVRKDGTVVNRKYGSQYHSLLTVGNIKFVKKNNGAEETLMETMTRGRVYATVGHGEKIQSIVYFDNENKRSKQIDIQHVHKNPSSGEKLIPHVHHGYEHNEHDGKSGAAHLTKQEKAMVDRVLDISLLDQH